MSRRLCQVLPCVATATHWVDDGQGDDSEYCQDHAEHLYERAMAKYRDVHPDVHPEPERQP